MQFVNLNTLNIEYGKVSEMMKVLTREVTSVDEYIEWVREWRKYHGGLVQGIKGLRDIKNAIKAGTMPPLSATDRGINRAQNSKLTLRPFAKQLYDLRVERKANFKAGVYGDPTFKVRSGVEIGPVAA